MVAIVAEARAILATHVSDKKREEGEAFLFLISTVYCRSRSWYQYRGLCLAGREVEEETNHHTANRRQQPDTHIFRYRVVR